MDDRFLSMLRCPRTGGELRTAGRDELAAINEALGKGNLKSAEGRSLDTEFEGALISACGNWLYPVREGIPVLLVEEALEIGKA